MHPVHLSPQQPLRTARLAETRTKEDRRTLDLSPRALLLSLSIAVDLRMRRLVDALAGVLLLVGGGGGGCGGVGRVLGLWRGDHGFVRERAARWSWLRSRRVGSGRAGGRWLAGQACEMGILGCRNDSKLTGSTPSGLAGGRRASERKTSDRTVQEEREAVDTRRAGAARSPVHPAHPCRPIEPCTAPGRAVDGERWRTWPRSTKAGSWRVVAGTISCETWRSEQVHLGDGLWRASRQPERVGSGGERVPAGGDVERKGRRPGARMVFPWLERLFRFSVRSLSMSRSGAAKKATEGREACRQFAARSVANAQRRRIDPPRRTRGLGDDASRRRERARRGVSRQQANPSADNKQLGSICTPHLPSLLPVYAPSTDPRFRSLRRRASR